MGDLKYSINHRRKAIFNQIEKCGRKKYLNMQYTFQYVCAVCAFCLSYNFISHKRKTKQKKSNIQ